MVATDFSDLIVSIALFEKEKYEANEPLYIEKNNILDDMEHKDDRWSQQDKDFNTAHDSQQNDHLTSIEVPFLPKGDYMLMLAIPQAHWFMTKGTPTCLSMDFMMEFMPRDANVNEESLFVQSDGPVQVLGVYPPHLDSMILARPLQINIKLDRHVDFRSIAQRTSEMAHMCQLQNDGDLSKYFAPKRYQYQGDNIFLVFSFSEDEAMIKDIYRKVASNRKQAALCWSLQC